MEQDRRERLHKVLAGAGLASRRRIEDWIRDGRVTVNGEVVTQVGARIDPWEDEVTVDGAPVSFRHRFVYLLLHKPAGYITTANDPEGRPTVLDLIPNETRVFPVGRLDLDSEGLLVFTNNGDLAYRLTHPRFSLEKEYHVLVEGRPPVAVLQRLETGVDLEGQVTAPAKLGIVERQPRHTWLSMTIHEGRKRQVRRMLEGLGFPVIRLVRVRLGPLPLGDLPAGRYRHLSASEVRDLRAACGL